MNRWWTIGLAAALVVGVSGHSIALQADPFDTARYYIKTKSNAEALALIDSGKFDVNFQTDEGYSLLHYAADANNLEMVEALLARGADPTLKSKIGSTPYDMAVGSMVKARIAKAIQGRAAGGGSAAVPGPPQPSTPAGPGAAAKASNGACAAAINDPANSGRQPSLRPVMTARDHIWYNKPVELGLLLDDCLDPNAKDNSGWPLLHIAADRDRVEAARVLLTHGASKTLRDPDGKVAANYATSPEMKALLGPAAPVRQSTPTSSNKTQCEQKYRADAALCSDSTCRMGAMRKWQQCLKTGRYW
ncbi:hypothetical protein FPZ54_02405 [Sphingomonas suaedae]|uniref:Uncharacterized protein n=1 Tax=Sphingomonas suaedae TaxID=2599297 RepID=A0A518RC49_9SPHN|nr:ankyrin repeat domain-containing protein [Sphingomonas suaedae]QDX24994.1 hypothetical protein FPZ54_02405 [Sphingomonas suaedae]